MDPVRRRSGRLQRLDNASRAQEAGLRGQVRRVVELDRGCGMDHDLARLQLLAALVAQPQAITPEIDLDDRELVVDEFRERRLAPLLLEALERGARKHLALEALGGRAPRAVADRAVHPTRFMDRSQAFLDDRLAKEAGAAADQDGLALQG